MNLYRNKLTDFHLNKRFAREAELFCEGLRSVVPLEWLCWFDGLECSQLVSGEHQEFDLGDFAAHVEYSGGFTPNSETIVNLWEVLVRKSQVENETESIFGLFGFLFCRKAWTLQNGANFSCSQRAVQDHRFL